MHSENHVQGECYCDKICIFQIKLRQATYSYNFTKTVLKLAFCTKFYLIFAVLKAFNLVTIVTENVLVPTGGFQNTSFVVTLVMRGCKIKKLCLPFFILVEDITIPYVKVQGKDSVSIPCLLNKTRGGEGGRGWPK